MWSRSLRKQEWWNIRRTVVGVGRRDWRWSGLTWVSFPQPPPPPFRPSPVTNQIVELPTLSCLLPNILISLKLIKSPHQNLLDREWKMDTDMIWGSAFCRKVGWELPIWGRGGGGWQLPFPMGKPSFGLFENNDNMGFRRCYQNEYFVPDLSSFNVVCVYCRTIWTTRPGPAYGLCPAGPDHGAFMWPFFGLGWVYFGQTYIWGNKTPSPLLSLHGTLFIEIVHKI